MSPATEGRWLRRRADRRTVAYLAVAVAVSIAQWNLGFHLPLFIFSLLMGVATAVISHNHNHLPIWRSKLANQLTSYVISIYYGHPAVAWIPTHNIVHHKLNNRPGDSSFAPKVFKGNHLLGLLIYPTLTGIAQMADIKAYFAKMKQRNRKAYWAAVSEYVVFWGFMAAIFLVDWRKALLYFLIPQQFALFLIQIFNYVQHIEADAESEWNHSRNFVSPVLNAWLFNNGYHTVHHYKPGVHWTQTPALHAEHAHKIDPGLIERSWWGYMARTFLLRPLGLARPPAPLPADPA